MPALCRLTIAIGLAAALLPRMEPTRAAAQEAAAAPARSAAAEPTTAEAAAIDAADLEHFERHVRPLLIRACFKCHALGERSKSGLSLDSRQALVAGGSRGPAIEPGRADESLLVRALRHDPAVDVAMPPSGRLSDDEIDRLAEWIDRGAPWPDERAGTPSTGATGDEPLWSFQPLRTSPLPVVSDSAGWCRTPIDRYILAALQEHGLEPASAADRRTLIRRLTFDLVGLPPTLDEIDRFLADDSPHAWERLVDRLLASPHYGERWGRHWLDLVRYAETDGHEYDPAKPYAWRYRDWVIAALNDDLPYDRFVAEHIAGDLLADPRLSADGGQNLSVLATAFYWLGEVQNVPVDVELDRSNRIENQLDVLGKAFLGLTLGCARCHDHKFDPITAEDYYGLAGIVRSSQKVHRAIDTPQRVAEIAAARERLEHNRAAIEALRRPAELAARRDAAQRIGAYLLGARDLLGLEGDERRAACEAAAAVHGLDPAHLSRWATWLDEAKEGQHAIFYPYSFLAAYDDDVYPRRAAALAGSLARAAAEPRQLPESRLLADFEQPTWDGWTPAGQAFGTGPTMHADPLVRGHEGQRYAGSDRGSDALVGRLISQPFRVESRYITFRIAGGADPQRTVLQLILNGQPLPELSATGDGTDVFQECHFDVKTLRGHEVHLELVDEDPQGHILLDDVRFADELPPERPPDANERIVALLNDSAVDRVEALAAAYQAAVEEVLAEWAAVTSASLGLSDPADDEILAWALRSELLLPDPAAVRQRPTAADREQLDRLEAQRATWEAAFPVSTLVLATDEAVPLDVPLEYRGEPSQLGPVIPRGTIEIIAGRHSQPFREGSGRLELARWLTDPENPLTARVLVNRVWQHHFGRGLVPTSDNFGRMGQPPLNDELLDYLTERFIASGWSIKWLHRAMLLSAAYQQSGHVSPAARDLDPENALVHHMPPRRLEAEAIRDAMLAAAGNLDRQLYGASVPTHLTPFMQGRDLPSVSGPLDGQGRRSIYLEVRRNHLMPLLLAFDFPKPTSTVGQRSVSIIPAQALVLMNNPFVVEQAAEWARRIVAGMPDDASAADAPWPDSPSRAAIATAVTEALGRPPDEDEREGLAAFLAEQRARYAQLGFDDQQQRQRAWQDLCQAIMSLGEFVFVR